MKIRLDGGLLFVSAELTIAGVLHHFPRVLLDTGSSGTLFAADLLLDLGIVAEPQDRLLRIRGVGGSEFVFANESTASRSVSFVSLTSRSRSALWTMVFRLMDCSGSISCLQRRR